MIKLSFKSEIKVEKEDLVKHSFSMEGVNFELFPWIRLTYPKGSYLFKKNIKPPGQFLFRSLTLFLGIVPIDLHSFYFYSLDFDGHFVEMSNSLVFKQWNHTRIISSIDGGSLLEDYLEFSPRLVLFRKLVKFLINRVFLHRHNKIKKKFGVVNGVKN